MHLVVYSGQVELQAQLVDPVQDTSVQPLGQGGQLLPLYVHLEDRRTGGQEDRAGVTLR